MAGSHMQMFRFWHSDECNDLNSTMICVLDSERCIIWNKRKLADQKKLEIVIESFL